MWRFEMNGYEWGIVFVEPLSPFLIDRTGKDTVATTDPSTQRIYILSTLSHDFFWRVLVHELGHAAMFSYYLIDDIHALTNPNQWIEAEEWTCNFMADYGWKIFEIIVTFRFSQEKLR